MDDYNFPLFIEFELQLQFAQNCEIIFHFTFFFTFIWLFNPTTY